ncbi:UNKNOWN [Stylonychia lemnae]|uniref:Uncharacterized protein n=1 Tax=Stylonychia lemnae TaxID=5949 RepID=A0A078AA44_STYLE|nr:UNKNOWN [Stylonychia lemnae]|eukprot:CDW78756.1 UNKNOWN [Stylonychia lemnae]
MQTQQMILRANQYKGQSSRSRYIVTYFKNDAISLMVFSYLWTSTTAAKRIRELNSKSQWLVRNNFTQEYPGLFIEIEKSQPMPLKDIFFDDFADFNFVEYKDVHIHEIDLYHDGEFLNGIEVYYLVDGDIMKYALHHKMKIKSTVKGQPAPKVNNPMAVLFGAKKQDAQAEEDKEHKKTSLYFKRNEYIKRVKISGQAYLHQIEIETNDSKMYRVGARKALDHDCEFEIQDDYKIISFAGVLQILQNDCRLLNLQISSKQLNDDCENTAEISPTYREVIQLRYEMFNPLRNDMWEFVKRMKCIKLFPGKIIGKEKEINPKYFVLGGIKIVYELKNGEEFESGIESLRCQNYDMEPAILELRDNEYITTINGTGKEYVQEINMETNFYRKIKQGAKIKGNKGDDAPQKQNPSALVGLAQLNIANSQNQNNSFSMSLPPGAKVIAIAGSADDYIRSVFAYYKV